MLVMRIKSNQYRRQRVFPCPPWTVQAAQPALSAWGPGCPCTGSGWSNGRLYKYDKTQSSVPLACSWDPHPGLEHSSPAKEKLNLSNPQRKLVHKKYFFNAIFML